MKKKVVIFLFYPEGGMYHYCLSLAKVMSKFYQVYFFIPRSVISPIQQENLKVIEHDLPRLKRASSLVKSFNILAILKQILQINPDVIHFPNTNYILSFILPILKIRFPIVTTLHDPLFHPEEYSLKKMISRQIIVRNSDSIIVHDRFGKNVMSKHISSERIFIVRHISVEDVFNEFNHKTESKIGNYVLFFGRLSKYKGLEILAKASRQLLDEDPSIEVRIFGKGKLGISDSTFKQCDNVLIENRFIKEIEIPQIFLDSRFVVLPYINASQSGIIPLAYYFGKPVLITKVGGLPESVRDGETGIIIQHNDPNILAEKIRYLWNLDNKTLIEFGKNCRKWLKENIDPSKIAKETSNVYLETIKLKNTPKSASENN